MDVCCTPPEVEELVIANSVPEKSKTQYEKTYNTFHEWCRRKNVQEVSENVLLTYLIEKSQTVKCSTLWSTYSMLKCMINQKEGIDIRTFPKLIPFIKKQSVGYLAKKTKIFTREEVNLFLKTADDERYLLWKIVLIMGISGALRAVQLKTMTIDDIRDMKSVLIVRVPDVNKDKIRTFTITNPDFIENYRKYVAVRPIHAINRRFLLRYENGRCTTQVVGIHKIGEIPSLIAKYLGLPNSKSYTANCYKKTAATLFSDRANIHFLKYCGGWESIISDGAKRLAEQQALVTAPDVPHNPQVKVEPIEITTVKEEISLQDDPLNVSNDNINPALVKNEVEEATDEEREDNSQSELMYVNHEETYDSSEDIPVQSGLNGFSLHNPNSVCDDMPDPQDLDAIDLMFLDFAKRFKLLSISRQLSVKGKLCKILAQAEMAEIEERQRLDC